MTATRKHAASGPPTAAIKTRDGLGRRSSPYADRVSDALRGGTSAHLTRRRRATALTLLATAALGVVEAYQTGLLTHVPEPHLPGLGADVVDASGEAYRLLSTPDAALGIASYGTTLVLLGMGADDRGERRPYVPIITAAKVAADAASAVYLFAEQVTRHRKICSWCTLAGLASLATLPLVLPEARDAWNTIRRRG